jgi:hypothetical protein
VVTRFEFEIMFDPATASGDDVEYHAASDALFVRVMQRPKAGEKFRQVNIKL